MRGEREEHAGGAEKKSGEDLLLPITSALAHVG